jgi:hypothetical protein
MRRRGYAALIDILLLLGVVIIVGLRHVPEQDTPTIREQLEEEEREYEKRLYGKAGPKGSTTQLSWPASQINRACTGPKSTAG